MTRLLVLDIEVESVNEQEKERSESLGLKYEPTLEYGESWVRADKIVSLSPNFRKRGYVWMDIAETGTLNVKMDPIFIPIVMQWSTGRDCIENVKDDILCIRDLEYVKDEKKTPEAATAVQ